MTSFSVVIPTRNRPALFGQALASVLSQQEVALEVIVVNDGSDPSYHDAYQAYEKCADPRVRFIALAPRPNGNGPSYALNSGVQRATGDYVAFLDDDDCWTDPGHLRRADFAITLADEIDLYMADQTAWFGDMPLKGPVWIDDLLSHWPIPDGPDEAGCYSPTAATLLRAHGFCHLNTLIVRRAFFLRLGGLDEGIRYEGDREFYLRAVDQAAAIRYAPVSVSRHNVPKPGSAGNVSSGMPPIEKRLAQLRVLDKIMSVATKPEIRRYAAYHKVYTLQHLTLELAKAGQHRVAAEFARQALAIRPSLSWLMQTVVLTTRAALKPL